MRFIPVLALAALAASTAGAQGSTPRARVYSSDSDSPWQDGERRAALGVGTSATGTLRDTLGVMITSITRGSPAEKAGLEEGNRLAAINGVSLRANAADIEDSEMSGTLTRRLTRELAKVKPGDDVELRVYRDGRTTSMKVKTTDSDSLFRRRAVVRVTRGEMDDRPALGIGIANTGGRRDTLGVLVMSVGDSTPAARAGIEEGNRIAAINGVNLRVSSEDAADRFVGSAKAQRLRREISQLKPGSDVTLRVYSNGQFRDVRMKVARAGDLPKESNRMMYFGDGMGMLAPMAPMGPMPPMMRLPSLPRAPREPMTRMELLEPLDMENMSLEPLHIEIGPQIEAALHEVGVQLERVRPQLDRVLRDLPRTLERIQLPTIEVDVKVNDSATKPIRAPRAIKRASIDA
jgi:S1-C subfamily serine protease